MTETVNRDQYAAWNGAPGFAELEAPVEVPSANVCGATGASVGGVLPTGLVP